MPAPGSMTRQLKTQSGFTIIEVMVAMTLLLVGVLGSVRMIDNAGKLTISTRSREAATNLARQIADYARSIEYDHLATSQATTDLQAIPALADASVAAGWQIVRRGITLTVTVSGCVQDDSKDGARSSTAAPPAGTTFCASSVAAGSTTKTDNNPDDFRLVRIEVTWPSRNGITPSCSGASGGSGRYCVTDHALVQNPTGGLGPSITSITRTAPPEQPTVETDTKSTYRVVTASAADVVDWQVDDGVSTGTAAAFDTTNKTWDFTWTYPASNVDGLYTFSVQAFSNNIGGPVAPATVTLNRAIPNAPSVVVTPRAAGVNTRLGSSPPAVEVVWQPNPERDIVSYRVYRTTNSSPTLSTTPSPGLDPVACQAIPPTTSCVDTSPPSSGSVNYYVVAFDKPWTSKANPTQYTCAVGTLNVTPNAFVGGAERPGCPSAMVPVNISTAPTSRPSFPAATTLTATTNTAGQAHLAWSNVATPPAGGSPILFYRIYRETTGSPPATLPFSARYAITANGTVQSYDDTNPAPPCTYSVTAVDNNYQESDPLQVACP
jgi:prepilin-type N-terminal cleavage/methylation domain-containing protein